MLPAPPWIVWSATRQPSRPWSAKLRPPAEVPNPQLASLIADLDSSTFATREAASKKLRELGATAEPALRKAQAAAPSPEARNASTIFWPRSRRCRRCRYRGETLRGVRVVEVLERIGTAEARELLQAWAKQGRDPRVAAEARIALERLGSPATQSSAKVNHFLTLLS